MAEQHSGIKAQLYSQPDICETLDRSGTGISPACDVHQIHHQTPWEVLGYRAKSTQHPTSLQ